MKLYKLSFKNIKKSFKDYAIYFSTLILGISIFYVFNALDSQTVMMNVSSSTRDIIKLMITTLSAISIFVAFVLGFLIIYASQFLMKRRNKEFGTYMILGMSKRNVSKILLSETLLIGVISLVVGLGIGVLLSQFMSVIVVNLFEADMTEFAFVFSKGAMIKTIVYFAIIYFVVMIFNTFSVSKCKVIDLLQASKKSERVKMKNPVISTILFLIACVTLGVAYYKVTIGINSIQGMEEILKPIILGIVGTFLLFFSLSGLLLKIVSSIKGLYYNGLNFFVLRQISSKINTTVFSMTIISLMLFMTICILSSGLSIKNSMTNNLKELVPADIQIYKNKQVSEDSQYFEDSKRLISESLSMLDFDVNDNFKNTIELNIYSVDNVTLRNTLGSEIDAILSESPYLSVDIQEEIVRLSDYNKIAMLYGNPTYELDDNEYIIIADFKSSISIRNRALKLGTPITIGEKTYYPKYTECQEGFIYMSSNHINTGMIIVSDNAVDDNMIKANYLTTNYNANTDEEKELIEEKIEMLDNNPKSSNTDLSAVSKISIYESSVGLGAMITFIAIYLGIIFLLSSAAILALKELSESTDNRLRYQVLRKIGVDEKMINRSLFGQISIFFLFPLVVALIHSVAGIQFCNFVLETFGDEKLLLSLIITSVFIVVIYGGYLLLTYFSSKYIIKER